MDKHYQLLLIIMFLCGIRLVIAFGRNLLEAIGTYWSMARHPVKFEDVKERAIRNKDHYAKSTHVAVHEGGLTAVGYPVTGESDEDQLDHYCNKIVEDYYNQLRYHAGMLQYHFCECVFFVGVEILLVITIIS